MGQNNYNLPQGLDRAIGKVLPMKTYQNPIRNPLGVIQIFSTGTILLVYPQFGVWEKMTPSGKLGNHPVTNNKLRTSFFCSQKLLEAHNTPDENLYSRPQI